jgi:DNA-binding transcriptional LysR family regulator
MELQKLNYFLVAAQTQNFNRAAELCAVAQPVLSRQIAKLEAELGVLLFQRHQKRVRLTPAGVEFAGHVKAALERLEQGQQVLAQVRTGERGTVSLGCVEPMATTFLPERLTAFSRTYPNIQLQMTVKGPDEIREAVEQGELDLGLVGLSVREAMPTNLLVIQELYRDQIQLVVRISHPLAHKHQEGREIWLEEALAEPLVLLREGFGVRRALEGVFTTRGYTARPVMELDLIAGVKEFVKQGAGVSFLLSSLVKPEEGLVSLPVSDLQEEFSFALVYRRIGAVSQPGRTVIKALQSKI